MHLKQHEWRGFTDSSESSEMGPRRFRGEGDPWIVTGKRPAPAMTLEQRIQQMRETGTITYRPEECRPVENDKEVFLAAEPARRLSFHCPVDGPDAIAVQVLAKHGDDGWVAMCFSEREASGPTGVRRAVRQVAEFVRVPLVSRVVS
jgi:hypothetical protein